MDRSAFLRACDIIVDRDLKRVSPIGFDGWTREGAVNQKHALVDAIGSKESSSEFEIIRSNYASYGSFLVGIGVDDGISTPWKSCRQGL